MFSDSDFIRFSFGSGDNTFDCNRLVCSPKCSCKPIANDECIKCAQGVNLLQFVFVLYHDFITSFGFGQKLSPEFSSEVKGSIPEVALYDKWYGSRHWNATTIRSLSIGQGEIEATPLQMVNLCAMIANRGYYIMPHVVRAIQMPDRQEKVLEYEKKTVKIRPEVFATVIGGMEAVVSETRTLQASVKQDKYIVCGKTGTVQNPHGVDHSAFVGFVPKDNPKIAVVVFIENAGFGATYAAPIGGLIMKKYMNDSIAPKDKELEQKLIDTDLLDVKEVKKTL